MEDELTANIEPVDILPKIVLHPLGLKYVSENIPRGIFEDRRDEGWGLFLRDPLPSVASIFDGQVRSTEKHRICTNF